MPLPSRAAEAAAAGTLHPNPAAEATTLTLAAPTRPGTVLTLTDALGRRIWSREVAAGQTSLLIALAGQPASTWYSCCLPSPRRSRGSSSIS